jgi:hypothetical protein
MDIVYLWYILSAKAIWVSRISNFECTVFVVRMFCVIIRVSQDVFQFIAVLCVLCIYWLYYVSTVYTIYL